MNKLEAWRKACKYAEKIIKAGYSPRIYVSNGMIHVTDWIDASIPYSVDEKSMAKSFRFKEEK